MRNVRATSWGMMSVVILLAVSPLAFGQGGNHVSQGISMNGDGGFVSQNGANAATVFGSNNQVNQDISQNAQGNHITQSGANAAAIVGDNNTVDQGVRQDAEGNNIAQSGANAVAIVGNDNYANQDVTQQAQGNEIYQTGWNSGTIAGDGNTLIQRTFADARTRPVEHVDPVQEMSNFAYIMGSYNAVSQQIMGYAIVGTGTGPVDQTGSNLIQTPDMAWNAFDQGISFTGESGPGSEVMQSAQNEIWIGPRQ